MINLPLKVLIGAGVAGAIGGGGYGIYLVSRPEKIILDVLKEKKLVLLTENSEWDEKVNSFGSDSSNPSKLEGFEKNTENNKQTENREAMKKACEDLVKLPAKDADKLGQAEKWCTKSATS